MPSGTPVNVSSIDPFWPLQVEGSVPDAAIVGIGWMVIVSDIENS